MLSKPGQPVWSGQLLGTFWLVLCDKFNNIFMDYANRKPYTPLSHSHTHTHTHTQHPTVRVQVVPPTTMSYGMTMTSRPISSSVSPTSSATPTSDVPAVSLTPPPPTMPTWSPSELATTSKRGRIRGKQIRHSDY